MIYQRLITEKKSEELAQDLRCIMGLDAPTEYTLLLIEEMLARNGMPGLPNRVRDVLSEALRYEIIPDLNKHFFHRGSK